MSKILHSLIVILAILLVIPALVWLAVMVWRYRRDITAARKRMDSLGSQVIETACGPTEYAQAGEGKPVLAVHGAMGGFDQGLWLARSAIPVPSYRLIAVSRFGYLRSPLPTGANLDMQADAFAALLDELNIPRAIVFAASAGTTSAIRLAARHPGRVSALILFGPDAPGEVQMPLPPRIVFDTLLRSDFIYWLTVTLFGKQMREAIGLVPKGYALSPDDEVLMRKVQLGDLPVSSRMDGMVFETYTCAEEFAAFVTPASPYRLNQIDIPVLVINAADDPISIPENVNRIVEQLPNARLFLVPEGGHFLFGHISEVQAEISRFLRSLPSEPDHPSAGSVEAVSGQPAAPTTVP